MQLIIAEKPKVGREIAKALRLNGKTTKEFIEDEQKGIIITWAIGHLVALKDPHEINPDWKNWDWSTLPMEPNVFELKPNPNTREQWQAVQKLIKRTDVKELVCATDAGREGELIFEYIYQLSEIKKPAKRLWTSSLTSEALKDAYSKLQPIENFIGLRNAAICRSHADWLIGMNGTRAATLAFQTSQFPGVCNVGRVFTPTLAILVNREKEIQEFKIKDYWTLTATFEHTKGIYKGKWFNKQNDKKVNSISTQKEADTLAATLNDKPGKIISATLTEETVPPEQFYNLSALQIEANKKYGYSPARTLEIAQELYESGYISYPRTSARTMTEADAKKNSLYLSTLSKHSTYGEDASKALSMGKQLGKRFINDEGVEDHSALSPTEKIPSALSEDQNNVYDLIARRFIAAFYPDMKQSKTEIITAIENELFQTNGTSILFSGWQTVEKPKQKAKTEDEKLPPITSSDVNSSVRVESLSVEKKQTKPPKRYTEGELIKAMESAGKDLTDKNLKAIMKECGIGTQSTRGEIIKRLQDRGTKTKPKEPLAILEKKMLVPTAKGMMLIAQIPDETLKSPELTAQWESKLDLVRQGKYSPNIFMTESKEYLRKFIECLKNKYGTNASRNKQSYPKPQKQKEKCPNCGSELFLKSWEGNYYITCSKTAGKECFFKYPTDANGTPLHKCPECGGRVNITKSGKKKCVDCNKWIATKEKL